jgi:hypothetical protein
MTCSSLAPQRTAPEQRRQMPRITSMLAIHVMYCCACTLLYAALMANADSLLPSFGRCLRSQEPCHELLVRAGCIHRAVLRYFSKERTCQQGAKLARMLQGMHALGPRRDAAHWTPGSYHAHVAGVSHTASTVPRLTKISSLTWPPTASSKHLESMPAYILPSSGKKTLSHSNCGSRLGISPCMSAAASLASIASTSAASFRGTRRSALILTVLLTGIRLNSAWERVGPPAADVA